MKTAFLVTAYCNSERKYDVLKGLLLLLQKEEHDILLYTHSHVKKDVTSLVDYCIYDYRNPVPQQTERSLIFWTIIQDETKRIKLYTTNRDYGYTAISQIANGSIFLKTLGYDAVFLINYDLDYSKDLYEKTLEELYESYDSVLFEYNTPNIRHGLYLAWAYYKLTDKLVERLKSVSISDYVTQTSNSEDIAENYMLDVFTSSGNYNLIENELHLSEDEIWRNRKFNIKTKVNHTGEEFIPGANTYQGFSAYLCRIEGTEDYELCLWDIKENLSITVKVDDNEYQFEIFDNIDKITTLPLPMIDTDDILRDSIKISINGISLRQEHLSIANVCFFREIE